MREESKLLAKQYRRVVQFLAESLASSHDDELHDEIIRHFGDENEVGEDADDVFEEALRIFEARQGAAAYVEPISHELDLVQGIRAGGFLSCSKTLETVWKSVLEALDRFELERVRLYVVSEDESWMTAIANRGMGDGFNGQRRSFRDDPSVDVLRDLHLQIFRRAPKTPAPFEPTVAEEDQVPEWFCIFLSWNGKIVGKLSGDCKYSRRLLSLESLRPIEWFAPLLGCAIRNAKSFDNLASLLNVCSIAASDEDLRELMKQACSSVEQLPGVDHAFIFRLDDHYPSGHVIAECPSLGTIDWKMPLSGAALYEQLVDTCKPIVLRDVPGELGLGTLQSWLGRFDIRSVVIVPVTCNGLVIGGLVLSARGNVYQFTHEDVQIAKLYASQVGLGIQRRHCKAQSSRRSYLYEQLDQAVEAMLLQTNFERLAQFIVRSAVELFGAAFAVLKPAIEYPQLAAKMSVFTEGIPPEEWLSIEEHQPDPGRLVEMLKEKGWIEIANMMEVSTVLPGLRSLPEIRCFQGISLKVGLKREGFLFVGYEQLDAFDTDQRQRVRKFAGFAALCLQRASSGFLNETQAPQGERLKALLSAFYQTSGIITSASSGFPSSKILDEILKEAVECTRIGKDEQRNTIGSIELFDWTSNNLKLESLYPPGIQTGRAAGDTTAVVEQFNRIGVIGRAVLKKKPQNVGNVVGDNDYITCDPNTVSEIAVPILEGGIVLGVLNLECDKPNAFDDVDVMTLSALASLATIAIQNAREAERDSLMLQP